MIKDLIALTLFGGAVMLTPSLSEARQPTQLMVGDPARQNVTFSFGHETRGDEGIGVETHQVGNPGAKLSIWVDRNPSRLFSRILTTDNCKYGDDGTHCRLVIARNSPEYRRFVAEFKRGNTVHIEVENAGVMQMSSSASLTGFTRKFGPQT